MYNLLNIQIVSFVLTRMRSPIPNRAIAYNDGTQWTRYITSLQGENESAILKD